MSTHTKKNLSKPSKKDKVVELRELFIDSVKVDKNGIVVLDNIDELDKKIAEVIK